MTSIPASRNARATTLAPRSWPSSPGLATKTLIRLAVAVMGHPYLFNFLTKLNEYTPGGLGMDKGYYACSSLARLLVDHLDALCHQVLDLAVNIVYLQADVVNPLTFVLQEFGHASIGID